MLIPVLPRSSPIVLLYYCRSFVHSPIKVETNSKSCNSRVLVSESKHETVFLLDCGSSPVGPETPIWLTEVDHVTRKRKVLMVCVGIPGQELWAGVSMTVAANYTEIVHQARTSLLISAHDLG